MISDEKLFAQSLEKVRRLAREQGNCISEEQVRGEFAALELSDEQLRMVFDYLIKHRVGIGEPPEEDGFLSEEEKHYLQDYLDEIARIPVCGGRERENCMISVMAGDVQARRRLTESYLKDVADIARLYTGQGVPLEELIGEGNVALSVAVGLLGEGKPFGGKEVLPVASDTKAAEGMEFAPKNAGEAEKILVRFIMDAMERFIQETSEIGKRDKHIADRVNRVADKARELAGEYHRKVTPEELMRETGLSMKAIQDAMRMSGYKIEDIEYAEDGI